jgi:hypothetical protein
MNKKLKEFADDCNESAGLILFILFFVVGLLGFYALILAILMTIDWCFNQDRIDAIIGVFRWALCLSIIITAILILKFTSKLLTWIFNFLKISILLKSDVVLLPDTKTYAIPLRMVRSSKIRLLIPELHDSYVNYRQENFSPSDVSLIRRKSKHQKTWAIRQISGMAKELVEQIQTQQNDLGDRLEELTRLEELARSSEVYGEQAQLYSRAKLQIHNLLQSNYQLEKEYEQFIREVLIGGELADYDLNNIPDVLDVRIRLDSKCKQVAAEYEYLKLEMQAYNILKSST